MSKLQFLFENYKDYKEMFGKVRKFMLRFVDSLMMESAINRMLNDIMDNKDDIEKKMKEMGQKADEMVRTKKVYLLAFKMNSATCTAESCPLLRKWIGRNGFSDDATSMRQFNPPNMDNITTDDMPEGDGSAMAEEDLWMGEVESQMSQIFKDETSGSEPVDPPAE
jgi:hypothetical protein